MKAFAPVLLLLSFAAAAAEPETAPAPGITWQQANKNSAALLRSNGDRKQAADFARAAFDLYPEQTKQYSDAVHGQLLLNLVDARRDAEGVDAALAELDRGAPEVEKRAGASQVLIDLWEKGATLAGVGSERAGRYSERALEATQQAFGPQDPRALTALTRAVRDLKTGRGYGWALGKYLDARKRAERSGDVVVADQISLLMAKLDLESGNTDRAANGYRALAERLERRAEDDDALLRFTYARLEHLYGQKHDATAAADVRRRRLERLPGRPVAPVALARVPPEYPRAATGHGYVEMELLIGADGAVQDAVVVEAEPAGVFEQAALDAIRKWKFKPKVVDKAAVVSSGRQRIDF